MNKGVGSPVMLLDLVEAVRRAGCDPEALLREGGLSMAALRDPVAVLDNQSILKIWEYAPILTGDECIGLRAAEVYRVGNLHIGDYLIATASTLRLGLAQWSRYCHTMSNLVVLSVVQDERLAYVRLNEANPMPVPRAETEYFLACAATLIRHVVGAEGIFLEAGLPHPAPRSRAAAVRLFGCNVRYGAPCLQLSISKSLLDAPSVHADPVLHQILIQQAAAIVDRRGDHNVFRSSVRRFIVDRIPEVPTLEETARALAVSPRTLRRLLAAEGASHQQVVDDVRREAALRMLGDHKLSVDSVAERLGFSCRSTFGRAFRRWTGVSPVEYRGRQSDDLVGG